METKRFPIIELRPYQVEAWRGISKEGVKESFLVWHRRAGKDLFCLQYLIAQAIQRKGNYWYVLPQQNQVRRAIWEGHITSTGQRYIDTIPKEWILKRYDSEMKLVLANPDGSEGSIISFVGSDNYDSLVGSGINGLVMSEFALSKPDAYRLAIRPMLMESNGWAILNTTPRGHNHAYKMLQAMKEDPTCYTSVLTVEDTGVVDVSVIDKERTRGTPEEIIQQEWYCSFEGAIHGAYYADMLRLAKVGDYPYDPRYPVHTCWDLGVSDSMAIWFVQFIDGSIRLIDHYEASTYGLGHYVNIINGKNYNYAGHHLPHDGTHRQLTSTEKAQSIQGQLLALGLNRVDVIPRTNDVYSDIQQVRSILPLCQFNRETTNQGYEAILNYRREWDEDAQCFKNNPLHDWTSHSSDAFRIIPKILRQTNSRISWENIESSLEW